MIQFLKSTAKEMKSMMQFSKSIAKENIHTHIKKYIVHGNFMSYLTLLIGSCYILCYFQYEQKAFANVTL